MTHRLSSFSHFQSRRRASSVSDFFLGAAAILVCTASAVFAQHGVVVDSPAFRQSPPTLPDSDQMRTVAPNAYNEPPDYAVQPNSLFRTTRAIPTLNTNALAPTSHVEAGSVQGKMRLDLPTVNGNFPLLGRGFEPQDADLKFGPVFFKLDALSAALLFTDNEDLDETDRKSGVIGIMRLSGTLIVQLSEDLHIAASGSLVFLPFQGEFGLGGAGTRIPYSLGLAAIPAVFSQFTWDTELFGQPVLFADDLRTHVGYYSNNTRDDFTQLEPETSAGEDRAGRYAFRFPGHNNDSHRNETREEDSTFTVISNEISASGERLLPGDVRLHVRVFNENLWYNQTDRGLPTLRDGADVLLQEVHEDWRFKPYLSYEALYTDQSGGINHTVMLGITGPITEQLHLDAAAGVFYYSKHDSVHALFHLDLRHVAGPYTTESLFVGRTTNYFQDEIVTGATYTLHQILGPRLEGSLFATVAEVEDLTGEDSTRDEFRAGLRLAYTLGPRTVLQASGIYAKVLHDPNGDEDSDTWTGRLELRHRFTDTVYGRLLYQYQVRDSNQPGDSYYENLLYVSLTKYFR